MAIGFFFPQTRALYVLIVRSQRTKSSRLVSEPRPWKTKSLRVAWFVKPVPVGLFGLLATFAWSSCFFQKFWKKEVRVESFVAAYSRKAPMVCS